MNRVLYNKIAFFIAIIGSVLPGAINSCCQTSVDAFVRLHESGQLDDYKGMVQLFQSFDQPVSKVVKILRNEVQKLKKSLKSKPDQETEKLLTHMQMLLSFVKKHKIQYEAIRFHREIELKYQELFDMVEESKDIIAYISQNLEQFDLEKSDKKFLHTFVKDLRQVSHRVSLYEDYIHADNIDLKLQNYVFKIELIKLRNSILFDKRYKQQK